MDSDLRRVSGGLTARQRAWAQQHTTYEQRPRGRAGRQILIAWTYHRQQIDAATRKWAQTLKADTTALAHADAQLADATTILQACSIGHRTPPTHSNP